MLTASGGPFRGWTGEQLADVTPEQALAHPTWSMGPVITVNSATLVNKGLEVIEAHLLFGVALRPDRGRRAPHLGRALDGRVRRRLHPGAGEPADHADPDRAGPGLAGPGARRRRRRCDWSRPQAWEFFPLDDDAFPAVALARAAGERGRVPRRRSTTPPTRSAWTRSWRAGWPSGTSCPRSPRVLAAHDVPLADARPHRGRRPRRRRLGACAGRPPDPRGDAHRMTVLLYTLGVIVFVLAILVSIGLHEVGHMVPGQEVRREGHAVLHRLRPHGVVASRSARPSTASRRSRSAATSRSSACSRPAPRAWRRSSTTPTAPAREGAPVEHRHVHPAGLRRPRRGVGEHPRRATTTASSTRCRGGRRSS